MEDDFSNIKNFKKQQLKQNKGLVSKITTTGPKPKERVRFVITKNKSNSWVDDLQAQAELNQMERIFH